MQLIHVNFNLLLLVAAVRRAIASLGLSRPISVHALRIVSQAHQRAALTLDVLVSVAHPESDLSLLADSCWPSLSHTGNICAHAGLDNGCCNWNNDSGHGCYVPGGKCFCDEACHGMGDCCSDVDLTQPKICSSTMGLGEFEQINGMQN